MGDSVCFSIEQLQLKTSLFLTELKNELVHDRSTLGCVNVIAENQNLESDLILVGTESRREMGTSCPWCLAW